MYAISCETCSARTGPEIVPCNAIDVPMVDDGPDLDALQAAGWGVDPFTCPDCQTT